MCRVAERNESGRAFRITLDGMTPDAISGQDLRSAIGRTLGWQYLQSASFQLKRSGNAFRFTGHGNGHGVGLCVIGSAKLAENGETARQILERYFPGTTVGTTGSTPHGRASSARASDYCAATARRRDCAAPDVRHPRRIPPL